MNWKNAAILCLTGVMLAAVVSGCGASKSGEEKISTSAKPSITSAPINKNVSLLIPYHTLMETFKNGDDLNNNKLLSAIKEKTGFNPKYESLPKDNPSQKIAVIIASGDVPDLLVLNSKEDYFKLAKQGAFEPLDELYAKHNSNLSKLLTKDQVDAIKLEGKMYAIPSPQSAKVYPGLAVRTDILKELGLKTPATLDEFYQMLKTMKEKKNIIPLSQGAANPGEFMKQFDALAGAFGVAGNTVNKNGKLEFAWTQPEWKSFLTYSKKLFDEGLLDQEFAVNKDLKTKLINGSTAALGAYWSDVVLSVPSLKEKLPNATVDFIAPPTGPNGQSGTIENPPVTAYFVIPKMAKNKEGAMAYLDALLAADVDKITTFGLEGQDYTVENGKIKQTLAQSDAVGWRTLYIHLATKESFQSRLETKGFLNHYNQLLDFKQIREETFYAPSIEAYDNKFTELRNFAEENAVKFVMGKRPLDEFDKYVQEFNAKGGTNAINAMNEWFTSKK